MLARPNTLLYNIYHTAQVARTKVEYVRQWVDGKRLPAQVATGDTTTGARTLCANG